LPISFTYNGICNDIINIKRPEEDYLILESKEYENGKLVYICALTSDSVLTIVMFNII